MTKVQLLRDPIAHYPAATVACFDATSGSLPRRSLDPDKNVRFLEALARAGAPAVLIAASTGHGHLRTIDELREWYRSAAQADLGGTLRMALLRPEDGAEANARLLDELAELGFAVVFVRPALLPPRSSDEQIAENVRPIVVEAARRELPIGIYSIPDVSGVPLSAQAAVRLVEGKGGHNIIAAKITEADYERSTLAYLQEPRLRHLKIVQGWDPHMARALQDGLRYDPQGRQRCGVTSGPMSFAVHQYVHILQAASRQDWAEVAAAQQAVTVLFESMQDDPRRFADLQRAKYIMGLGHSLTGEATGDQVSRVLEALSRVPRPADQQRLARSLNLLENGPFAQRLAEISG